MFVLLVFIDFLGQIEKALSRRYTPADRRLQEEVSTGPNEQRGTWVHP
jgi:hypothetical protein